MTRSDLKKWCRRVQAVAEVIAESTETKKDDEAVELFGMLLDDKEKFDKFCDVLGLAADAPPAPPAA